MAIGLAQLFGFRFQENFDYPYVARSIQEFWRRWHISLSAWFRDYLYIPLGGNRVRAAARLPEPRHRVLPVRPLARRELDLRGVGPLPRRLPGARARSGSARVLGADAAAAAACLRAARGDGGLGVLPRRVADRRPAACCGRMAGFSPALPTPYGVTWYLTPEVAARDRRRRRAARCRCGRRWRRVWRGRRPDGPRLGPLPSALALRGAGGHLRGLRDADRRPHLQPVHLLPLLT